MDFSYLIFAAFWSRAIFDQWPTSQAIVGMALIGSAGVITAWRERVTATGRRLIQ
jgi:drug/metabolite transporter (DMT)-like permease